MHHRLAGAIDATSRAGAGVLLVTTPANTHYLSGFRAITYSRPVVVVAADPPALIVPELEEAHARGRAWIEDVRTYSDRGLGGIAGRTPLHLALDLAIEAARERARGPLGFEPSLSYRGHAILAERWPDLRPVEGAVEQLRMRKDEGELALIRAGCRLADYGMQAEVEASRPGATELEIMARGDAAMLLEGARRHADLDIEAMSRPVSGEKTVLPHSIPTGKALAAGEVVIHGTGCIVGGYWSEDERTIAIGGPTSEQARLFEVMRRAQQAGIAAIRPGVRCLEVDRAARSVIEEAGLGRYFIHRTGHGIGLDIHELPFFAPEDDTTLEPGMVMSVEPGIYVPGVGGFRHSDTVVVTESEAEVLTTFPKDLEALAVTL